MDGVGQGVVEQGFGPGPLADDVRAAARPAVIRSRTAQRLGEYLRFRHLVRNLYTWNLEADKLADLIDPLPETLADLRADLSNFGRFLRAASLADEHGLEQPGDEGVIAHGGIDPGQVEDVEKRPMGRGRAGRGDGVRQILTAAAPRALCHRLSRGAGLDLVGRLVEGLGDPRFKIVGAKAYGENRRLGLNEAARKGLPLRIPTAYSDLTSVHIRS